MNTEIEIEETEEITQEYLDNKADNTFSFVFWYNSFNKTWYAIPRSAYTEFFAGNKPQGVITSNAIDTLIYIINNELDKNTDPIPFKYA
jgi:hypothetical protein